MHSRELLQEMLRVLLTNMGKESTPPLVVLRQSAERLEHMLLNHAAFLYSETDAMLQEDGRNYLVVLERLLYGAKGLMPLLPTQDKK